MTINDKDRRNTRQNYIHRQDIKHEAQDINIILIYTVKMQKNAIYDAI